MNANFSAQTAPIRVKFVAKGNRLEHAIVWRRQLPDDGVHWQNCTFDFDPDSRNYDWLVVYDDLPTLPGERFSNRVETLACPREHTLFITAEPSSIKTYGNDFLDQFGTVISSQEPWATPGKNVLHHQPALRWYYGVPWEWLKNANGLKTWKQIEAQYPAPKAHLISTVTSNKQMRSTEHRTRFEFVQHMGKTLEGMDSFGRGIRLINDKAEALDGYRYHLAIENHFCAHHFTEKLSDTFLGGALPFYYGCPNYADYFPAESLIPIDIHDFGRSLEIIQQAISDNEYEKRLSAIREARRRVLHEHNLFAMLTKLINERHGDRIPSTPGKLYSRRQMRQRSPLHWLRYLFEKHRARRKNQ